MRNIAITIVLIILAINTTWFVVHSAVLGWGGLTAAAPGTLSRVFASGSGLATLGLALHMVAGAVLTIGAPLQAIPAYRTRWPGGHRRSGYVLFGLAILTGLGGLSYILLNGTIGGWWMSGWFALYGALMIWAAINTVYFALDKDMVRHGAWATRLIVLAVGSWIYRMHYVIWYGLTDGAASNAAFTGLFDQIQVVAFFVPYLLIAEVFLRRRPAAQRALV